MPKKAIIFDLDNTIYSARSIGKELFSSLFQLINEYYGQDHSIDTIKDDIMRQPFQAVASKYQFGDELTQKGIDLLKNLNYEGEIQPFDDYQQTKKWAVDKFLVTKGFLKLQESKIRRMGIEHDFKEIHIVDPETSDRTKKDVFEDIIQRNGFTLSDVLVVGDDMQSEIKAAQELGVDSVLYDKLNRYDQVPITKISDFAQLKRLIDA